MNGDESLSRPPSLILRLLTFSPEAFEGVNTGDDSSRMLSESFSSNTRIAVTYFRYDSKFLHSISNALILLILFPFVSNSGRI